MRTENRFPQSRQRWGIERWAHFSRTFRKLQCGQVIPPSLLCSMNQASASSSSGNILFNWTSVIPFRLELPGPPIAYCNATSYETKCIVAGRSVYTC